MDESSFEGIPIISGREKKKPSELIDLLEIKYVTNPAINREDILLELQKALLKLNKPNAILIGEPGVGKTTIAEGLAYLIKKKKCHELLQNKKIYLVSTGQIISGTRYRGDFEQKIQKICDYLKQEKAILFIDEMHTVMTAGKNDGSIDMANILKPYLSRGDFSVIGATTNDEYEIIKDDGAYNRRFTKIFVDELDEKATENVLNKSLKKFQTFYNMKIDKKIIPVIVKESNKIKGKNPDKSIDILENTFIELLFGEELNNKLIEKITKKIGGNYE